MKGSDNFNVKGVSLADKDLFERVRQKNGFRYNHEVLAHIFKVYQEISENKSIVSDSNSNLVKILEAEIEELKTALEAEKNNPDRPVSDTEIEKIQAQLTEKYNETILNPILAEKDNQIADLTQKIEELEQSSSSKKEVQAPSFVLNPGIERARKMQRVIAYQIKQGKMQKSQSLLEDFTNNCIDYSIKNEFSHILK